MIRHRVGELARAEGYSYWQFARKMGIGTKTARDLYENPYYSMTLTTLDKCCEFFDLEPSDLIEREKGFDETEKKCA